MSSAFLSDRARRLAARVWAVRRAFELEAAQRFRWLAGELRAAGASVTVRRLADQAATDELRHAELCSSLSRHFGDAPAAHEPPALRRVAPRDLDRSEALVYELVALACVTETLSTALLGALVERATDSLARRTMHSILRDEVRHSRIGWAYLAEAASPAAMAAVSRNLAGMLTATVSDGLYTESTVDPAEAELTGLGQLERGERRRVVCETLEQVVFPGLVRFGADVQSGRRWLAAADPA